MANNEPNSKRILAVLAHPDDETFGMGGTLAHYARLGAQITLACATLGEAGIIPEGMLTEGQEAGDLRRGELDCALENLGVQKLILLGYRDSGMLGWEANQHPNALINQSLEDVTAKILDAMQESQPELVLTFDPIGGYRHPDHIHTHKATVAAFEAYRQGHPHPEKLKLLFHLMPTAFLKAGIWSLRLSGRDPRRYGASGDIDLVDIANQNFPRHYVIRYHEVADKVKAASLCHASQGGDNRGAEKVNWLMRLLNRPVDYFMQAWPLPAPKRRLDDLFKDSV